MNEAQKIILNQLIKETHKYKYDICHLIFTKQARLKKYIDLMHLFQV